MFTTVDTGARTFDFFRDTFAFRNELYWEYLIDDRTGRVTTRKNDPAPTYAHRCFVVVRSVRQFFLHARFAPDLPSCAESEYIQRIRQIVRRSPFRASAENEKITIPGAGSLRDFSSLHGALLKNTCGGAWQSYVNKQHWRMIFPFTRAHQGREAERLKTEISNNRAPILHIVRFPQLTINHALLLYGFNETADGIQFSTYDPNLPEAPSALNFKFSDQTFHLPRNIYWAGGRVDVYETYRD